MTFTDFPPYNRGPRMPFPGFAHANSAVLATPTEALSPEMISASCLYLGHYNSQNATSLGRFLTHNEVEIFQHGENEDGRERFYVRNSDLKPAIDFAGADVPCLEAAFGQHGGVRGAPGISVMRTEQFNSFVRTLPDNTRCGVCGTQAFLIQVSPEGEAMAKANGSFLVQIPGCSPLVWPTAKADFETGRDETVIWFKATASADCVAAGFIPVDFEAWTVGVEFHLSINSLVVINTDAFARAFPGYPRFQPGALVTRRTQNGVNVSLTFANTNQAALPPGVYRAYEFGTAVTTRSNAPAVMLDPMRGSMILVKSDEMSDRIPWIAVFRREDEGELLIRQAEAKRRIRMPLPKHWRVAALPIDGPRTLEEVMDTEDLRLMVPLAWVQNLEAKEEVRRGFQQRIEAIIGRPFPHVSNETTALEVDEAEKLRIRAAEGELVLIPGPIASLHALEPFITCPVNGESFATKEQAERLFGSKYNEHRV